MNDFRRLFRQEPIWITALAVAVSVLVLLYIRFVFLVGIGHDEVEHAHAAFRILSGELPYRDFYQNHWPAYWMLVTQWVQAFPFSIKAILAARVVSLLALAGCWYLGLRLLEQIPGGRTKLAMLVYTTAMIALAYSFEFWAARPDPVMALFGTAGWCLFPLRGELRGLRSLGLGVLFGLAISVSSKAMPFALIVPVLAFIQAMRSHSLRPLMALPAYAAGVVIALLPTALWIYQNDLFEAFRFDVFDLNMAVSKPWYQSFEMVKHALVLPSFLGALAWSAGEWTRQPRDRNGCLAVLLALSSGILLAFIARHPNVYNLQLLAVPLAVGFTSLVTFLWGSVREPVARLILLAALLAYPAAFTVTQIALIGDNFATPQAEVQELMDLARPGNRTCSAFSPLHPVFCHSVSQLSNQWDFWFTTEITEPAQVRRFQRIWNEGIERILEVRPDIILRKMPEQTWEAAADDGLISREQLDALDALKPDYEVRMVGNNEVWLRRSSP